MNRDVLRQLFVIVFALSQWFSTAAVSSTFYEIDDSGPGDYFIPAEGTFIVWGFIYIGASIYAVYQALPSQRKRTVHRRIGWWLGATYALCSVWILTSVQGGRYDSPNFQPIFIGMTVVIIIGMLFTLLKPFIALRQLDGELTRADRWLAQVPASIYFAWINVAVIANTTSALIAFGIDGEPYGALWSAALIVVAGILTSAMILYSRAGVGTLAYTAVVAWAFLGIYLDNNAASALVGTLAIAAMVISIAVTGFHLWTQNRTRQRDGESGRLQQPAKAA
jgi:multisubunit Na+/H+ antiporter MnhC subunit